MKFLIFNIIVFCSLGYLLTSQPNENFSEWAGNTKEKLSQISKKEVIETIKKATGEKKQIINVNKNIIPPEKGGVDLSCVKFLCLKNFFLSLNKFNFIKKRFKIIVYNKIIK